MENFEPYPHFFKVELEQFEGPIDLLLHLVKQHELPIEKLSLAHVSDQYLEALEAMRFFDIEVAAEYLVIAATLVSIKSSVLLSEPNDGETGLDIDGLDPHEELLHRLREAEIYQDGAKQLSRMEQLGVDIFPTPPRLKGIERGPEKLADHDPYLLGKAFRRMLEKAEPENPYRIELESVSIVERMMNVLDQLKQSSAPRSFESLVPANPTRGIIVGTFIALLELCKRQTIRVSQEEEEILIRLANLEGEEALIASEFDEPIGDEEPVLDSVENA